MYKRSNFLFVWILAGAAVIAAIFILLSYSGLFTSNSTVTANSGESVYTAAPEEKDAQPRDQSQDQEQGQNQDQPDKGDDEEARTDAPPEPLEEDSAPQETDDLTSALELMGQEEYGQAVPILLKITEQEPENAEAYAWLAACYGSIIDEVGLFQKLKYNRLMEEALDMAVTLEPDSALVHMVRGNRYLNAPAEFGGDVEKAIEDFTYCIENGMEDADIYYSLGQAYEKNGEPEQAAQAYENALKQDPDHTEASEQLDRLGA
ncbi:tetratricopeptide repeat protein [Paenibacillus sp. NEAU-GSW1]|uniref:tetratricopeptide repeat protein n=1 Tax=Paenibacillus sp. NEAU-GSW1 TaxID=2682486 RepID=UPI0012E0CF84|nr:tetratricopeptide repeat protein [Paenibacillus sp. NEAU-GSW1]MUT64881.1 tetratricopeptide repeat protein [Paenibacillus sp. NEAU-GSW1]